MLDIRQFIKNLGPEAPAYFDVKPETIKRWIKTGNVPIKVAQRIFAAAEAMKGATEPVPPPMPQAPVLDQTPNVQLSPGEDPITHLPVDLDRNRQPQVASGRAQSAGGPAPDWIEQDPTEQSFGNNFTRPGRISVRPMPPMKLRDEGGQRIAYRENTPPLAEQKNPDGTPKIVLPPSIATGTGWAEGPPTNEPKPETKPAEGVS